MSLPPRLVLASASPRRHELLARLGVAFAVVAPEVDETPQPDESPTALATRLAATKARWAATPGVVVLAADTVVAIGNDTFGKPIDRSEAEAMLRRLAGRSHEVVTGVAVLGADGRASVIAVSTMVAFRPLDEARLAWYLDTGEWEGKAGAYAVQGAGDLLVERVDGSVSNIVGLPLGATADLLALHGVDWTASIAYLYRYAPKKNAGFLGMLDPNKYDAKGGLHRSQPFHKDKIPVILVHGLMSTPETWLVALNKLRSDPVLRERYQAVVYRYPTGYNITKNAADTQGVYARVGGGTEEQSSICVDPRTLAVNH